MHHRRISSVLVALLVLACTTALSAQPSTVILVRHAEKAAVPGPDPALSEAGEARAKALAAALEHTRIGAVITTQFQRTRATGAPLATALGLTPITVSATADGRAHVQAVAEAVKGRPAGETVLVVGHSNTIPAIIRALGGPALPDLCESEYDRLFILTMDATGPPRLIRARFGEVSSCPSPVRQ
jgi:broad specificity phosphatase PhoE